MVAPSWVRSSPHTLSVAPLPTRSPLVTNLRILSRLIEGIFRGCLSSKNPPRAKKIKITHGCTLTGPFQSTHYFRCATPYNTYINYITYITKYVDIIYIHAYQCTNALIPLVGSGAAERVCGLERTREGATMGNFNFSY